jgi:cell division protein FtsW
MDSSPRSGSIQRAAVDQLPVGWPRRHRPDYVLIIITMILLTIGLVVIYSISPALSLTNNVSQNYFIDRQMLSIVFGFIAFILAITMPISFWKRLQNPLIVVAGVSAVAVRLFGQEVNGAYRWIQIGGVSFQSAELIKIALLIWLAGFLSNRIRTGSLADNKKTLYPVLACLAILGFVVAGLQSDLGSTGVMVVMIAAMAFVAGMPIKRIGVVALLVVALLGVTIAIAPYRLGRIETYLHPSSNCLTTGYQACQALISVGSGGAIGLGLGRSVQAYGYLPEAADDSIFAIYSEKFGFIGDIVLLALFMALFVRIKHIIDRAPDDFTKLLCVGILVWFGSQTLINVGGMIGLLPLKGITLPFISYGGTSLVFVIFAIGLLFQISRYTTYQVSTKSSGEEVRYDNNPNGRRVGRSYNPAAGSSSRT